MSPHMDDVKEHLRANQEEIWGFVIYHCTYGDDEAWDRMMNRLKIQALETLKSEDAEDLFPRIDWTVQQNPSWDKAGQKFIKQRFVDWKKVNHPDGGGGPRTYGCIMIDKQSLDTLEDERTPPENVYDLEGRSWVWMVSSSKGEKTTRVGISYLMPRTWLMLDRRGWEAIWDNGFVATP